MRKCPICKKFELDVTIPKTKVKGIKDYFFRCHNCDYECCKEQGQEFESEAILLKRKGDKMAYKDNLKRPFEKPETEEQRLLHTKIRAVIQEFALPMSYPELFDVMDRVKLSYQLDMLKRDGRIKWIKQEKK